MKIYLGPKTWIGVDKTGWGYLELGVEDHSNPQISMSLFVIVDKSQAQHLQEQLRLFSRETEHETARM